MNNYETVHVCDLGQSSQAGMHENSASTHA